MSNGRAKELLAIFEQWAVIISILVLVGLTGVYYWGALGVPRDPDTDRAAYMWRTYAMSVSANLIPVFLLFMGSYFLLRQVRRIQAAEERDELKADVKASVAAGIAQEAVPGGFQPPTVGYAKFRDEPPWAALIQGSSTIRIVVHYFDTWINQNEVAIRTFFAHGGKLHIVLPDYGNSGLLDIIKGRFQGQQKAVLESKIRNTFEKIKTIRRQSNRNDAVVEAFYLDFAPWYCAVEFDQRELVISPYEHNRGVAVASPAALFDLRAFPPMRDWFDKEFKYLAASAGNKTKKDP